MLSRTLIVCWVALIVGPVLIPTGALAAKGAPQEGTWNWPPYAGTGGGMPGTACGYQWVNGSRDRHAHGQWVYRCH
jgi:hypothetical protein